jgi:hypothetical protein
MGYIVCLMVGGTIGFLAAALCVAAKDPKENEKAEYYCKTNAPDCNGQCCGDCLKRNECNWVCGNSPEKCKQSIRR